MTLALGADQAPAPSAQQEADVPVPRFALPDAALPSLPPLGVLGSNPAVRQAVSEAAQAPSTDPGMAAFRLPDLALPQLGLPLLAQPELPKLPFGHAPAEGPALPALPELAGLAITNTAKTRSVQADAQAEASAKPASGLPSNSALSVVAGAFAPAASALQAGAASTLQQLQDPVSLPQLGLPLLARPELPELPFGQAPAGSAAPPFARLADFGAADMQSPEQAQAPAANLAGSRPAFPSLGAALAPGALSAQALLAGLSADLPQLKNPAWSLPQLGVPLLALPGAQLLAGAPAPDLAAAMTPMIEPPAFIAPLAPNQVPDGHMGAPSQQPFPVPAAAPAQQGLDVLADLPRLALPRLPLFSGLAQAPALVQGSQGPDLAQSSSQPADLRTDIAPSSSPQPGLSLLTLMHPH